MKRAQGRTTKNAIVDSIVSRVMKLLNETNNNYVEKVGPSERYTCQCDQIWWIFATLAQFYVLENISRVYLVGFAKFWSNCGKNILPLGKFSLKQMAKYYKLIFGIWSHCMRVVFLPISFKRTTNEREEGRRGMRIKIQTSSTMECRHSSLDSSAATGSNPYHSIYTML